jgi:hypothetical protein
MLSEVIQHYLESGDFNGLPIRAGDARGDGAETLIRDGLVEVIDEEEFPNPHIRPWSGRRSVEEQVVVLRAATEEGSFGVCLYPTASALADLDEVQALADRPYTQRLAAGSGQLDVAFFRMDVLESYRNDPRFTFVFDDVAARAAVSDAVYENERETKADKVSIRLGFAYLDASGDSEPIVRFVAAFLRDLAQLSPEHQRRWETYEVQADCLKAHPIWLAEAFGHWIDRIGPFDALFAELTALDELFTRAFGVSLLSTTERPPEFGWMLRPSQMEFDTFVQTLDKLLSENLRHDAFDAAGIDLRDEHGQTIGTLNRLDRFLERAAVPEEQRRELMKPFRVVRAARSKPAHALRQNISDSDFIRRQAELLRDVTESVEALRRFLQTHPRNREWEPPAVLVTAKRLWL